MSDDPREREALRRALGPARRPLDAWRAPAPPEALVATTLRRATAELVASESVAHARADAEARAAAEASRASHAGWPVGFRRELARLLGAALVPAAGVLALNALLFLHGPALLDRWLPEALATALPAAYAFGALGWLSLVVGSLPFLAHRRATARPREVTG